MMVTAAGDQQTDFDIFDLEPVTIFISKYHTYSLTDELFDRLYPQEADS